MTLPRPPRDPTLTQSPSAGPCFLYVATAAYEDLLKLGFSRDPLARLQTLHRRWYEAFDLERSALVATETVRDARALELRLRRQLAAHNAPAPLTIRHAAGGHTEWYRGAGQTLRDAVLSLAEAGYTVHLPATFWLRQALVARADLLYGWSSALMLAEDDDRACVPADAERAVRDVLDAYTALKIDLQPMLPAPVWDWYGSAAGT